MLKGALTASIYPITAVIFSTTPAGPVILMSKIVGAAVGYSAYGYISEAKKIDEQEENEKIVAERQKILRRIKYTKIKSRGK
jgi:pyruvoyl-dependent arginine decarboxylase (PvlArgDC)